MGGVTRVVQRPFNQRNEVVREVFMSTMPIGCDWIEVNGAAKGFIGFCPVLLVLEPSPVLVVGDFVGLDQVGSVANAFRWAPLE